MTAIFSAAPPGSMDIKHEMIYRDDDMLHVVKSELSPSPTNNGGNNVVMTTVNNLLTSNNICNNTNNQQTTNNGLVTTLASSSTLPPQQTNNNNNGLTNNTAASVTVVPSNGLGANNISGPFSSLGASANKRPRADDWLSSPSPGTVTQVVNSAPPLTPSPGPPSHPYTVINNGYSSPMSSGSYDPYSPNGKIGKLYSSFFFFFFFLNYYIAFQWQNAVIYFVVIHVLRV